MPLCIFISIRALLAVIGIDFSCFFALEGGKIFGLAILMHNISKENRCDFLLTDEINVLIVTGSTDVRTYSGQRQGERKWSPLSSTPSLTCCSRARPEAYAGMTQCPLPIDRPRG